MSPPITWISSSPAVATISNTGVATGVTPGLTNIVAKAGKVSSLPAVLTVTDTTAGACNGITSVTRFTGEIDYGFKAHATSDGGFTIDADDGGHVKATMTQVSNGPIVALWAGDVNGNASVTQQKSDGTDVSKYSGGGPIVPLPQVGPPKMSLIVNLQTCTYRLVAGAVINTILTDPDGAQHQSVDIVAEVQFWNRVPPAWRTVGLFGDNGSLPAHSVVWAALNPDVDALLPFGFAASLFDGSPTEPPVGSASGGYLVLNAP